MKHARAGWTLAVAGVIAVGFAFGAVGIQADQGQGRGGGGGGNGGGSGDTPLIMVFRDAAGDGLTSDGGAYIAGGAGINRAQFVGGEIRLDFVQPKGNKPPIGRLLGFTIDCERTRPGLQSLGVLTTTYTGWMGVYKDAIQLCSWQSGVLTPRSPRWLRERIAHVQRRELHEVPIV